MADETDPDAVALALLEHGMEVAVVKQGTIGTLVHIATKRVYVPVTSARIRNGLGASDDSDRVMCHGLLQSWDLARTSAFASAAGVIIVSRLKRPTATPRIDEVERLMAANPQVVPVASRIRH